MPSDGDTGSAGELVASGHVDPFARAHLPPRSQWPYMDAAAAHYPARLNCVAALLDAAVAGGGGARVALCGAGASWSYQQLQERVNRIANVLLGPLGLVPGNRVLVRGANEPMMAACILAVFKAGCIAVPTMPQLRARELGAMLAKARVDAVLCAADLRAEIEALAAPPVLVCFHHDGGPGLSLEALMAAASPDFEAIDTAADDVCLISFTSGTTGVPKATMHFHRDLLAICDCFPRAILAAQADDVFIGTPPLAFTFGLGGLLLFPLRVGACAVLLDKLTPDTLLAAAERHRATICFTAPVFYRQMAALAPGRDLSSLRLSVSAGEALPPVTRAAWHAATGLDMIDGIGATEMLHIFVSAAGAQIRPGAIGRALPGYEVRVVDADGRLLGPGQLGRLAVRGPTGCRYLDDARQQDYVQDGWNLTGDVCEMDADGYVYYRARADDMIVSSGYNIAGAEVEDALLDHPAVAECAVIGRPDEARGQIVEAHVVLRHGCAPSARTVAELQDFVKQRIAPYKYPRAIRFLSELPRTETGKLQRFRLRAQGQGA